MSIQFLDGNEAGSAALLERIAWRRGPGCRNTHGKGCDFFFFQATLLENDWWNIEKMSGDERFPIMEGLNGVWG